MFGWRKPARKDSSSSPAFRYRPHLEALEARTMPSVLTPAQVRHAYGFDQITFTNNGQTVAGDGTGQTIAIVDAYDDPHVLADLQYFDKTFGLANPNFTKATPEGTPTVDSGWAMEIALDVEWAHAMAPGANILLVEAKSSNLGDLLNAVNYARNQSGVVAVSMSWGANEFSGEASFDSYFTTPSGHPGVTFVASSGDSGASGGPEWPAVSANVLSVGGTHLNVASNGAYQSESGWSGSGGGYSSQVSQPAYQSGFITSRWRTNPDVSYDADPNSGVYVYDTVPYGGSSGWWQVGGTSAGAPQWAALIAIADQGRALAGASSLDGPTQTLYAVYKMAQLSYSTYYHDVTTGNNGYGAKTGYDLVTGLGSPKANAIAQELVKANGTKSTLNFNPPPASQSLPGKAAPKFAVRALSSPVSSTAALLSATASFNPLGLTTAAAVQAPTVNPPSSSTARSEPASSTATSLSAAGSNGNDFVSPGDGDDELPLWTPPMLEPSDVPALPSGLEEVDENRD